MTASIYELVGRLVVRFIRVRYRKQIRIAAALGIGAICSGVVSYLLSIRFGLLKPHGE